MTGIAVGLVRNLIRARAASSAFEFALTAGVGHHHAADKQRESARPNSLDWAERAPRFSPIDRLAFARHQALAIAHFQRGRYEEAANAARRAVLSNSSFSVSYSLLAAALVKLGRTGEAQAAARQVLVIDPSFSSGGYCKAVGVMPILAKALIEAWREAGLPP